MANHKKNIPPELFELARLSGLEPDAYPDTASLLDALAARPEETAGPEGALEGVADALREAAGRLEGESTPQFPGKS